MTKTLPFVAGFNPLQFTGNSNPFLRPNEWRLARMLEAAANPESSAGKQVVERMLAAENMALRQKVMMYGKELMAPDIMAHKQTVELLSAEAIESTTLIQAQFYSTVLEGAEPNKVMRSIIRSIPMTSNQQTFTLGESGSVLGRVSEGAEIPINRQDYAPVTLTSYKYGERGLITNELIEDGLYDVIALEIAKSGARAENTLNHVTLTTLIDDAGNEHDCTGSNLGAKAIFGALALMRADGYNGTAVIGCSQAEYQLFSDSQITYANYYGNGAAIQTGQLPTIAGMPFARYDPFDTTYNSGTYVWGYNTDSYIGMVLVDVPSLAGIIGMRRDISVVQYDDPIRDLVGAAITMRFATGSPFDNGICRVEY